MTKDTKSLLVFSEELQEKMYQGMPFTVHADPNHLAVWLGVNEKGERLYATEGDGTDGQKELSK